MGLRLPVHPLLLCREVRDREDELNKRNINTINNTDMKKEYITPSVVSVSFGTVSMMAVSSLGTNETEVDTSTPGGQLGREDNGFSRPNVWENEW